jgi:hypothetical protein
MRSAAGAILFASLFATAEARAQATASHAQAEARNLSASPDAATIGIAFRRRLRGKLGAIIPFVRDESREGFFFQVPALVEIHNHFDNGAFPYEMWRGRLAVEAGWRTAWRDRSYGITAAVEHESDHPSTSGLSGWVQLNSASIRNDLTIPFGDHFLTFALAPRFHFLTCTNDRIACARRVVGSAAFEALAEIVLDIGFAPPDSGKMRAFVSAFGSWMPAHARVLLERRLVFEAGFSTRNRDRGLFQLYATTLAGNDVGYRRGLDTTFELGLGFRWTP